MMTNPRYIPIWEQIIELGESIPPEELDKIPSDLSMRTGQFVNFLPEPTTAGIDYDAPIEVR